MSLRTTKIYNLFILQFFLLFFIGCTKEEESPIIIYAEQNTELNNTLTIRSIASKGEIERIKILYYEGENGYSTLLDTCIGISSVKFLYTINTNKINDNINPLNLLFVAVSSSGEQSTFSYLYEIVDETPLKCYNGVVLYSKESSKLNCYNFSDRKVTLGDSLVFDSCPYFYEYDINSNDSLSLEWRGSEDLLFAKFNDFDFSGATKNTLQKAYSVSVSNSFVKDLSYKDIVILGIKDKAIAVAQMIAIFDEEGTQNDRYVFNLKIIDEIIENSCYPISPIYTSLFFSNIK